MRRFVLAAALACVIGAPISAAVLDPWDPLWHRRTGWTITAVTADGSRSVYVTGAVEDLAGGPSSMVLARYASAGDLLWRRTWRSRDPSFPSATGRDVAVAPGGERVYVVGAVFNDTGEHARSQLWAYSASGRLLWRRTVWGPTSAVPSAVAASQVLVVVGGTTFGECPRPRDGRLTAFTSDGVLRWRDPFEVPGITGTSDQVEDVMLGPPRALSVVGSIDRSGITCEDAIAGRWSDQDAVVRRMTLAGRVRWTRVLADPGVRDVDEALSVDADRRQVLVGGRRDARPTGGRSWLASFSTRGRPRWSIASGPAGSAVTGVALAPSGPAYVTEDVLGKLVLQRWTSGGVLASERRHRGVSDPSVDAGGRGCVYVAAGPDLSRMPR